MCGIVGYVGKNNALPILMEGLRRLEYRGYDSAGVAVIEKDGIKCIKSVGKVKKLETVLKKEKLKSSIGIAHTRWATHGKPTEENAHPHFSQDKKIYLVHNGIIENYQELKDKLIKKGHKFTSDTDTEVVAHLIEEKMKNYHSEGSEESRDPSAMPQDDRNGHFEKAVQAALREVVGAYGLAIISSDEPNKIIAAKCGSPLLIGVGKDEKIVASDASAIIGRTKKVIYLDDGEIAVLNGDKVRISDIHNKPIKKKLDTITWDQDKISKGGYEHFMSKEIHEALEVQKNSTRGRIMIEKGEVKLGGLESVKKKLANIDRIIIVGCGTAFYVGQVGEYMIEEFAGVPVEVEYASEFRYRKPIISKNTVVLAISQSGETADTIAAIREAKSQGALTLGIVNVVGSTISRETHAGVYNHIGPEIAVATSKACISQLIILALMTVFLGRQRKMKKSQAKEILTEIDMLPKYFKEIFKDEKKIKNIAEKYKKYKDFLFLGRCYNFPIAMEGALKIKEISYRHAEGYTTGEMKHGPIAMIDKNFPSVVIAPLDRVYDKNISGIEEIKARDGKIIAIATSGDKQIEKICDDVIFVSKTIEMLYPLLTVVPLQLLGYYIGIGLGYNVDKPRNLAKSVTVE
jgi:glucosamine--fructose-6-phosphate aminotransferase (isomerizing)